MSASSMGPPLAMEMIGSGRAASLAPDARLVEIIERDDAASLGGLLPLPPSQERVALARACELGSESCLRALIERGVDPSAAWDNARALNIAAGSFAPGALGCLRALLALPPDRLWGAMPEAQRLKNLHQMLGHASRAPDAAARGALLLSAGAPLRSALPGSMKVDPGLCRATMAPESEGIREITFWLGLGAAVDERDREGLTPLMLCASRGWAQGCAALLAAGADPALRCPMGRSVVELCQGSDGGECRGLLRSAMEARSLGASLGGAAASRKARL